MSNHNMTNWTDYILSLGMEVAFGNCPIREQMVAEAIGLVDQMFYEYVGEEDQHDENCNFIYGNCDCKMSDPEISENDRIMMLIEKYD